MIKTIRNLSIIFIIILILCFFLMILCYTIPTEHAHDTLIENAPFMQKKYDSIPFYDTTRYDVYSDGVFLSEVSFYNKNVSLITNAMAVYGVKDLTKFQEYASGDDSVMGSYPRYWHGNLVILKPLFYFFDYSAVKVLELFFEMAMIIIAVKLMIKDNLKEYVIPFLLSIFLIHPEIIGINFQYWIVFNLMLISVIVLSKFKEILFKNNRLFYFFLVVGMLTSFLDILSFPLITFGMPMIFYILLEDKNKTLKENILKIILFGLTWTIGFAGMWVSKWIISTVILNSDVIGDAIEQLLFRTSATEFTRFDAILKNVLIYKKSSYLVIFGLIAIYYIKKFYPFKGKISQINIKQTLPLLLIAILPFVWYFMLSNHSYIHAFFTYRILLIFFFAVLCCLEYLSNHTSDC